MLFYIFALTAVAIDQISKIIIRAHMEVGESVPLNSFLQFTFYENSGMAFSLFQGYARWFGVIAVIVVIAVLYYRNKGELRGVMMEIGTGLFVGGAIGNAIDRFVFGKVTDFLDFRPSQGILNLADISIHIGVMFIIADAVIQYVKERLIQSKSNSL
ncbi:signal peptidase II [Paenibacillus sp. PvR052]|nr:signal peptidase II [Paenibacillus sp. PvP091]MBP1169465.1 signal peptidase II [Paenibacillus sp. PvR098]MBP2440493.1 signal peptidase II [Paenibacillus sp. PvP052]